MQLELGVDHPVKPGDDGAVDQWHGSRSDVVPVTQELVNQLRDELA